MTSQDIADLNGIYAAIGVLKEMHSLVEHDLRGTNDPRFDSCKSARIVIARADASYKRLADRLR